MSDYIYDKEHCALVIGDEAMLYHCHHYLVTLQKTVFDAEYLDGTAMIIGCAADSVYNQLSHLCQGLSQDDAKEMAEQVYKTFGNGLIDLSNLGEDGGKIETKKSILSKAWLLNYGVSKKAVDCYTSGFLAAAYAVIYNKPLSEVKALQSECMACGTASNVHIITNEATNFTLYAEKKEQISYKEVQKVSMNWEHEQTITDAFANVHHSFVGNEEGFIPAMGVYLVLNQSDYINRVQFEFIKAVSEFAGEYGETLGSELLMEAGLACGFFTLGGMITSPEWNMVVKPYLQTKEDWIKAAVALSNNMGWGYQSVIEVSQERLVFRNYFDFEDMSYLRMYGESKEFTHWANSGGWLAAMPIIYNSDVTQTSQIDYKEMYEEVRRAKYGYKVKRTKGISCGDDYLEMEVYI
jgi:hypothetical protein